MFEKLKKRMATAWGFEEAGAGASKRDPKKTMVKRVGAALKGRGGSEFEESVVDLDEVTKAYNTDSYVKRAIDKYSELMLKAGWEFTGRDDAITEYLWMRLKLIEEGTRQSIDELFKEISHDMVQYGNAFVVKSRQSGSAANAGGIKAVGYTGNKPINGYFVLPPTSIKIARDDTGKISGYEQDTGDGNAITIKPEDMIHFAHKKPRGRAFAIPYIWPVINDVKLLRQIEENVARLIYRNLFPLYQYKVGLDKPGFEASPDEIDELREEIRGMTMDGAIVVSERHNISVVSSNNGIMNADPYLKYYRQRVFSGLGVSDIVMGIGDTANRGTADNLSSEMIDGVKEFQSTFKNIFQREIIAELLFEGGYDPVLNREHEVTFHFIEIELDSKIKKENHAVQLFTQNAITHEELRTMIGFDPIMDENRLYYRMVTIPTAVETAASSSDAGDDADSANAQGQNKDQPTNQNGTQSSPKASASGKKGDLSESFEDFSAKALTESDVMVNLHSELKIQLAYESLKSMWHASRDDIMNMVREGKTKEHIEGFVVQLVNQNMKSKIEKHILESYYVGLSHAQQKMMTSLNVSKSYMGVNKLNPISTSFTARLVTEMRDNIFKYLDEEDMVTRLSKTMGFFNSNEYRLSFITKTEMYRAYNYGLAIAARDSGHETIRVIHEANCEACKDKDEVIELHRHDLLDAIPPHHTNCACIIKLESEEEV
jgi:hypothetical protein